MNSKGDYVRQFVMSVSYLAIIALTNTMVVGVLTFYFVRVGDKSMDNVTEIMVTALMFIVGAFVIQNRRITLMSEICKYVYKMEDKRNEDDQM